MVDLNLALGGFVIGLAAGIFLAYKIAQHSKGRSRPPVQDNTWSQDVGSGYPEVLPREDRKRIR